MGTQAPDGTPNWRCHSINPDGTLNCDSVTFPRADGLARVRFNGTYNIEVTYRIYNRAGNFRTRGAYRAVMTAGARDWLLTHDTGFLPDCCEEFAFTDWTVHTWYNNTLEPADSLKVSLIDISRQSSSFWPDFNLQFQRIRLTLNTSFEPESSSLGYESWLYGEYSSPYPPPPPA